MKTGASYDMDRIQKGLDRIQKTDGSLKKTGTCPKSKKHGTCPEMKNPPQIVGYKEQGVTCRASDPPLPTGKKGIHKIPIV